jgi:hypothetical protein
VISEQGSTLAYAVTERGETGKRKAYAAPGGCGSETGKSNDLCSSAGSSEYESTRFKNSD